MPNSAGGFAWEVDDWARLRRFLILGAEGGSYHASEWTLARENAQAVERCVGEDGARAVAEIARVSEEGPRNPSLEVSPEHAALFEWIVRGTAADGLSRIVEGFVAAQTAETLKRQRDLCASTDSRARRSSQNTSPRPRFGRRCSRRCRRERSSATWRRQVAGLPGLTPRDASAPLALVTAATESHYEIVGFFAGDGGFRTRGGGRFAGHADGLTEQAAQRLPVRDARQAAVTAPNLGSRGDSSRWLPTPWPSDSGARLQSA